LQRALESNTADLRNAILGAQLKGTLDPSLDAESLAGSPCWCSRWA
jgi:hypothetical protein